MSGAEGWKVGGWVWAHLGGARDEVEGGRAQGEVGWMWEAPSDRWVAEQEGPWRKTRPRLNRK